MVCTNQRKLSNQRRQKIPKLHVNQKMERLPETAAHTYAPQRPWEHTKEYTPAVYDSKRSVTCIPQLQVHTQYTDTSTGTTYSWFVVWPAAKCISPTVLHRSVLGPAKSKFPVALTLYRAEMSTGYTWPSRSNLHF